MDDRQLALVELGRALRASHYRFITPTPRTHRRVLSRPFGGAPRLEDIFGWNRIFRAGDLPARLGLLLQAAGCLEQRDGQWRSRVRFASLPWQRGAVHGELLLAHSPFPTDQDDAVFFGPDTYRFARAIDQTLRDGFEPRRVVDVGAGGGAGGLLCAKLAPDARIVLSDVNQQALWLAQVNAALNGVAVELQQSDVLQDVVGPLDFVISNPPYLVDGQRRVYRHGGGEWGTELALRILEEGLARLAPGGRLLLYTGTPVVDGIDMFWRAAQPSLDTKAVGYRYEEIDPDVFGEELALAPYDRADRIAAVMLQVQSQETRT